MSKSVEALKEWKAREVAYKAAWEVWEAADKAMSEAVEAECEALKERLKAYDAVVESMDAAIKEKEAEDG